MAALVTGSLMLPSWTMTRGRPEGAAGGGSARTTTAAPRRAPGRGTERAASADQESEVAAVGPVPSEDARLGGRPDQESEVVGRGRFAAAGSKPPQVDGTCTAAQGQTGPPAEQVTAGAGLSRPRTPANGCSGVTTRRMR